MVSTTPDTSAWERYAWIAGIVFVVAVLAESVVGGAIPINHNDSAAKIATELDVHSTQLLVVSWLSVVYAVAFSIFLWKLYDFVRANERSLPVAVLVLAGGALMISLHAVSDIGITGLLGAKLASYGARHDHGISYSLYLVTFAIDSVGDVFGSLFLAATGLLGLRRALLPRWVAWISVLAAVTLFLQGFGLGGLIATFGLVLDLVGFALFLLFVFASSVILLRKGPAAPRPLRDATPSRVG